MEVLFTDKSGLNTMSEVRFADEVTRQDDKGGFRDDQFSILPNCKKK